MCFFRNLDAQIFAGRMRGNVLGNNFRKGRAGKASGLFSPLSWVNHAKKEITPLTLKKRMPCFVFVFWGEGACFLF